MQPFRNSGTNKNQTMPKTGPSVLHGLTFEVRSGGRVGVGEHSIESDHRKMIDC